MKKWHVVILAVLFAGLATSVFAFGPPFAEGRPPFAGFSAGFRGPANFPGPFAPGAVDRPGFGPKFGPLGFAGGFGPWGSVAGLTSEQSAKLQAIQQEALKEVAPMQQEFFQKTGDLRRLMASRNPDEAKISALQKEVLAIQGKLQEKGAKFRLEAQKVAPEQLARLSVYGPGPGFGPGYGFAPGRARIGRPWW